MRAAPRWGDAVGVPLLCVPTAGNSELQFDRWPATVGGWRVWPVWPADAVDQLGYPAQAKELAGMLGDTVPERFGVFGHGGGALLAYELAVALCGTGRVPGRLFVSGSPAPQSVRPVTGELDRADAEDAMAEQVLAAVLSVHGNPMPTLLTSQVRALRADALARNAYRPAAPVRLPTVITVVNWRAQGITRAELDGWSACGTAELVSLPGAELTYATDPGDLHALLAARPAPT